MFLMEVKSFLEHFFIHSPHIHQPTFCQDVLYSHADKLSTIRRSHTYYLQAIAKVNNCLKYFHKPY